VLGEELVAVLPVRDLLPARPRHGEGAITRATIVRNAIIISNKKKKVGGEGSKGKRPRELVELRIFESSPSTSVWLEREKKYRLNLISYTRIIIPSFVESNEIILRRESKWDDRGLGKRRPHRAI